MKTKKFTIGFLLAGLMIASFCSGQVNNDELIAKKAFRTLRSASITNGISLGFALASNIELIAIGGFPLELDGGTNAGANVSHMFFAIPRLALSIAPPIQLAKVRRTLEPWRESPEMAASCKKLFANIDAAQILTAAAPVLCLGGGIMMIIASSPSEELKYDSDRGFYYTELHARTGLKTAGWLCIGAGLAASVTSAVLISISKNELKKKMGAFSLKAAGTGVGLQYQLPASN